MGPPLPVTRSQQFSTAADNQPSVEIYILMGERKLFCERGEKNL